jgi:hypothetical protein
LGDSAGTGGASGWTAFTGIAGIGIGAVGVFAAFKVCSSEVNPEACAGGRFSGDRASAAEGAVADASLPSVRSNSVNPLLPWPPGCDPGAAAAGLSANDCLSAETIRILSINCVGLSSAPPPNTTLWTTGSANACAPGAGAGT